MTGVSDGEWNIGCQLSRLEVTNSNQFLVPFSLLIINIIDCKLLTNGTRSMIRFVKRTQQSILRVFWGYSFVDSDKGKVSALLILVLISVIYCHVPDFTSVKLRSQSWVIHLFYVIDGNNEMINKPLYFCVLFNFLLILLFY